MLTFFSNTSESCQQRNGLGITTDSSNPALVLKVYWFSSLLVKQKCVACIQSGTGIENSM